MGTRSKGKNIILTTFLIAGVLTALGDAAVAMTGSCSANKYLTCATNADCEDDFDANTFLCKCKEGIQGDALKGAGKSGCGERKCMFDSDCHDFAFCNKLAACECNKNFTGDGHDLCEDIDECKKPKYYCHEHANCRNSIGGWTCTCDEKNGYFGDGLDCKHKCQMDYNCGKNEECVRDDSGDFYCVCKPGFKKQSTGCEDVDECADNTHECDEYGVCSNTLGGYSCPCINGYTESGDTSCKALPRNCHDILEDNPDSKSKYYDIDPDGPGILGKITVECEMRANLGITIIKTTRTRAVRVTAQRPRVDFSYELSVKNIRGIIASSDFCYQEQRYQCRDGAELMVGSNHWINGKNQEEVNWGGATSNNKCACGEIGFCEYRSAACNCNGTTETMNDDGKVIDKDKLPISSVLINPGSLGDGRVYIGPVKCGPFPFDIPLDCHDYKFNPSFKVRKDGSYFIDTDGKEGELAPELVYCDMESYNHVGVTVIPHKSLFPVFVPDPGVYSIDYLIGKLAIKSLIKGSEFCRQEVSYECKNSRLMNGGDRKGFTTSLFDVQQHYWAGGLGVENKCGCGLLSTCDQDGFDCNCDIRDNKTRKDFGVITDKNDLPVGLLTFNEIGGNSFGTYHVGPLMCGGREFGFPATCQDYVEAGYTDSHVFLVDTDGPQSTDTPDEDDQSAFPVYCEITGDPLYATTIVKHNHEEQYTWTHGGILSLQYTLANSAQLQALISRHVTCTQEIKYSCQNAPLHDTSGNPLSTWQNFYGNSFSYFSGDGTNELACECALGTNSCENERLCNCDMDDNKLRYDDGVIINKEHLPIASFNFTGNGGGSSEAMVSFGPLKCKELFPNCAEQKLFNRQHRLEGETVVGNGFYVIDADGEGEEEPFYVKCLGSKTVVEVEIVPNSNLSSDTSETVSRCYEIKYKSNGKTVSPSQVQALVERSAHCTQNLAQMCKNAPLTNHSNFTTCDGKPQTGWAGSKGEPTCSCGITGSCAGGPDAKCNCDLVDGEMREDGAWIVDSGSLAVCEVCASVEPSDTLSVSPKIRQVLPIVSDLFCDAGPPGKGKSCQDKRDSGMVESGTVTLSPESSLSAPFYCGLQVYPPMGWVEVFPKEPEEELPTIEITITVEYFMYTMEILNKLIEESTYCTQELYLELDCEDSSSLNIQGKYGWYSKDGVVQQYWPGHEEGSPGCNEGVRVAGGVITDTASLPISKVVFPAAPGRRVLRIGPLKCYNLYKDCHQILKKRARTNPMMNNTYAIDPDQGGPVEPFAVICDFKTNRKIGITVVENRVTEEIKFVPIKGLSMTIEYESTFEQIHALASISGFCLQGVKYVCKLAPLTETGGFYNTYGMAQSPSFGVADHPETQGCACKLLNTCPDGHNCHCDAKESMFTVDHGFETNKGALPIQQLNFPKLQSKSSQAVFDITNVRCAPIPFDLPKHCDEAYYRGLSSGEILIWPSPTVDPFLVYCNMKTGKGGVTIIGNSFEEEVPITFDKTMRVTYTNAVSKQIVELVSVSKYCYQPFKIKCRNMKLLTKGYANWKGNRKDTKKAFFGGVTLTDDNMCNCGRQGYCAGDEAETILRSLNRPCNCDASVGTDRLDSGVFNYSGMQAIQALNFLDSGLADPSGSITLGKLYCSEHDFDINECKNGWHDCDENAKCINKKGNFDCKCRSGWEGLGRMSNETIQWANGRNCYDDNECHLKMCPSSATCENTPGSFICTCKDGYRQTGKRSCEDIDECAENTHNCDPNARCLNLPGSYSCKCNWNYKGDGYTCEPVALCACFGDPHCLTFDKKLIDYQGTCQYIMARDMCDNINDTPTFELLMSTFVIPGIQTTGPVSWVKEVTFNIYGYSIMLMQENEVRVDGKKKNLPFKKTGIEIRAMGKFVEVYTELGVQLTWDGKQAIELYTPGQFMNQTCGFCGNYNGNPEDDLVIGPACPESEGQFTTNQNIFGNSWVAPGYAVDFPQCVDCNAENETGLCTDSDLAKAKLLCNRIWDKNGLFKDCLEHLEPELYDKYKYACIYDMCKLANGDAMLGICDSAEILVDICAAQYGIIMDYRAEEFCDISCNENKTYNSICGPYQQLTCFDYLTETEPDMQESFDSCVQGCFCKEGYYLSADGSHCVRPEDCGCYYDEQNYKIGDEITSEDCSEKLVCQANGTMTTEVVICHKDAICKVKKGRRGCHCKKDFYGDGITSCDEDKCLKNPCGMNETCSQNKSAALGYDCKCQMGFMGDCGSCVEVDECLTNEDDCPHNANCINTVGSFRCECKKGYTMYGGECLDTDECMLEYLSDEPICGNNSRCSNRIGSFECPCCEGFEKKNGECVESSTSDVDALKCCVCDIAICETPGEVCGEDGKTYNSINEMFIANCQAGKNPNQLISIDYYGKCRSQCQNVNCPSYQNCIVVDGRATCVCQECTEEDKTSPEVCTTDKDQYPNMCVFKQTICFFDMEATPTFDMEPCEKVNGAKPVGEWGPWGSCSVTCGKGTSTKSRVAYSRNLSPDQENEYPLTLATDCYAGPCPGSPCMGFYGCNIAAECVVNSEGEPECECPTCDNIGTDPVCGYVVGKNGQVKESTWRSECHLRKFACNKQQSDFEIMNKGHCGVVPRNCTRVPLAHTITAGDNDEYKSEKEVNLFDCEGGCGFIRNDCCQPIDTSLKTVTLINADGDQMSVTVKIIKECGCVDIGGE